MKPDWCGSYLELLLALLRGPNGLDQRLEPALLVDEEVVVLGVEGDRLLGETVRHGALPVVPTLVARLADVVVGALLAPVPVADDGLRPAAVAGDTLVLAEVRSLLFLDDSSREGGGIGVQCVGPDARLSIAPSRRGTGSGRSPPASSARPSSRPPWPRSLRALQPWRRRPSCVNWCGSGSSRPNE